MRFSKEDDIILRKLYSEKLPVSNIAFLMGREVGSIRSRACYLGIKKGYFFSKEEDDVLKKLYSEMTFEQIAKQMNRTRQAVSDRAGKLGLSGSSAYYNNKNANPSLWSSEEDKLLIELYGEMPIRDIIKNHLPNRKKHSITLRFMDLGLTKDKNKSWAYHASARRQYAINDHYFSKYTNENCYWAGFFAADGSIDKRSGNSLVFALMNNDKEYVEKFRAALSATNPIYHKTKKYKNKTYEEARITFTSKQIKDDLDSKFNIRTGKTHNLAPPSLTKENHIISFLVGFIDGDGCISIKSRGEHKYPNLQMCGTYEMMQWVKSVFDKWLNNQKHNNVRKGKGNYWLYEISCSRFIAIAKRLTSVELPRMKRKWDKLQPFLP